jgi:hypothetical protein
MDVRTLRAGIDWNFETYPEYLDTLRSLPKRTNIAALVPHSMIRLYVMGAEAAFSRAATDEELAELQATIKELESILKSKTKLNGVKQLYHTVRNDFDRPIYLPTDMRPAQAICEQCHWPKKYVGNVDRTFQHYLSDEKNTPFAVRLLLNVGGDDPSNGPVGGIHWHMNIANKIEYIATDEQLLKIPWVRMTSAQGGTTEYRDPDFKDDLSKYQVRQMSCLDCHSRPAHKVHTPNEAVDLALMTGRLDPNTPWVKSKVVAALVKPYSTKAEAEQGIANDLRAAYPDPAQANTIVSVAQAIYRENFFPEVKKKLV